MLPPLKPIPVKERMSIVFVEKGEIDVVDGVGVKWKVRWSPNA